MLLTFNLVEADRRNIGGRPGKGQIMGELTFAAPVAGIDRKGPHHGRRRPAFARRSVSRRHRDAGGGGIAFCAARLLRDQCAAWPGFFVEAVTDYIVHQEKPSGYISEDNADWLIRAISRDGMVDTAAEMELLVSVIEKSQSSPERLSAYALDVGGGGGPCLRMRARHRSAAPPIPCGSPAACPLRADEEHAPAFEVVLRAAALRRWRTS